MACHDLSSSHLVLGAARTVKDSRQVGLQPGRSFHLSAFSLCSLCCKGTIRPARNKSDYISNAAGIRPARSCHPTSVQPPRRAIDERLAALEMSPLDVELPVGRQARCVDSQTALLDR